MALRKTTPDGSAGVVLGAAALMVRGVRALPPLELPPLVGNGPTTM